MKWTKLKNTLDGNKAKFKTLFKPYIKKDNLIGHFICFHSSNTSYSNKYNDELYNGDVVEMFVHTGKKNHYYEVELAPNGTMFLSDIENIDGVFKGKLISNNFCKGKVTKIFNIFFYKIEIPLNKIEYNESKGITYNAFRIETEGKGPNTNLFALSPTNCGTFHKFKSFIRLEK